MTKTRNIFNAIDMDDVFESVMEEKKVRERNVGGNDDGTRGARLVFQVLG